MEASANKNWITITKELDPTEIKIPKLYEGCIESVLIKESDIEANKPRDYSATCANKDQNRTSLFRITVQQIRETDDVGTNKGEEVTRKRSRIDCPVIVLRRRSTTTIPEHRYQTNDNR